jgi:hypothetical protein
MSNSRTYRAKVHVLEKREVNATVQADSPEEAKALFRRGDFEECGGQVSGDFWATASVSDIRTPAQLEAERVLADLEWTQHKAWRDEVNDELKPDDLVYYSVGEPPQSIAVSGKVIFRYGDEKEWSCFMTDPTWMQVTKLANHVIQATGDFRHIFLEGVYKTEDTVDGIPVYELAMGS